MNKSIIAILVSACASLSFADEAQQPVIQLVNAAGIASGSVANVAATFQQDIHFAVAAADAAEIAVDSSAALAAGAAAPKPVAFRVVFWKGGSGLADSLCLLPDAKTVLVDVAPLFADDPDAERIERRLIRQAAKGCGLLAGLGYTPCPPCTLKRISSLNGLDSLSRNFSPPAQGKFDMLLRMEGAEPLVADSGEEEEE